MVAAPGLWARPRKALVFSSEHKLGITPSRGRKPDVCMYKPGERLDGLVLDLDDLWSEVDLVNDEEEDAPPEPTEI
jgi:hypothetical protein